MANFHHYRAVVRQTKGWLVMELIKVVKMEIRGHTHLFRIRLATLYLTYYLRKCRDKVRSLIRIRIKRMKRRPILE